MGDIMLDSASLYEILTLLRKDNIEQASQWTIESAFLATSLLITCPHFKLPPSPAGLNKSKGDYELLLKSLSDIVSVADVYSVTLDSRVLLNNTDQYIALHKKSLKNKFINDFSMPEVQLWIEEGVNYRWQKDIIRKNGIFDKDIITDISILTGITVKELNLLWSFGNRKSVLDDIIKHTGSDEYRLITRAYLAAAIIRGIYHDYVARQFSNQIYHHPLRSKYLPQDNLDKDLTLSIELPLSFKLYVFLIFCCSFQEKHLENRIKSFVHNIALSRKAYAAGNINFNEYDYYDAAINEVVRSARTAGIRAYPKHIDSLINFCIISATTLIGSFLLNGWAGAAVGFGASTPTIFKIDLGEKVAQASFCSSKRLERLVRADGGRIDCIKVKVFK